VAAGGFEPPTQGLVDKSPRQWLSLKEVEVIEYMHRIKLLSVAVLIVLAAVLLLTSGCQGGSSGESNSDNTPVTPTVTKPNPVVESVVANSTGELDKYYAILNITIKNDGAEGMILLKASITQGDQTTDNDISLYMSQGERESVKLVFPLKWQGDEWTPHVTAEVP
jgi:hypothetical protein